MAFQVPKSQQRAQSNKNGFQKGLPYELLQETEIHEDAYGIKVDFDFLTENMDRVKSATLEGSYNKISRQFDIAVSMESNFELFGVKGLSVDGVHLKGSVALGGNGKMCVGVEAGVSGDWSRKAEVPATIMGSLSKQALTLTPTLTLTLTLAVTLTLALTLTAGLLRGIPG